MTNTNILNGRINSNQLQGNRLGVVEDCAVISDYPEEDYIVDCQRMTNCYVESGGRGVRTDYATNVEAYAEHTTSLQVRKSAQGCRVGRDRRCATPSAFKMTAGQTVVNLGNPGAVIEWVFRQTGPSMAALGSSFLPPTTASLPAS